MINVREVCEKVVDGCFRMDVVQAISEEIANSLQSHGDLSTEDNHFRALAILIEEVGEVSRALLELRRQRSIGKLLTPDEQALKKHVIDELVQLVSVSLQLIHNLRKQ